MTCCPRFISWNSFSSLSTVFFLVSSMIRTDSDETDFIHFSVSSLLSDGSDSTLVLILVWWELSNTQSTNLIQARPCFSSQTSSNYILIKSPHDTLCLHHLISISSNLLHFVANQAPGCWALTDALISPVFVSYLWAINTCQFVRPFYFFFHELNGTKRQIWHVLVFHSVVSIHMLHMIACDHNMTSQYSCQNYSDLDASLPSQGSPSLKSPNTNIIIIKSNLRNRKISLDKVISGSVNLHHIFLVEIINSDNIIVHAAPVKLNFQAGLRNYLDLVRTKGSLQKKKDKKVKFF